MFNLATYNVKGLQQKSQRLKMFNYIKDRLKHDGFFFMQEAHSTPDIESKWKSEWEGDLFFSHGESNARGVVIGFTKNFDCKIEKVFFDNDGRILIIEMLKDGDNYLLVNFYNANTEADQIIALNSLNNHLARSDPDKEFKPIFMGDMNLIFDTQLDALGGNPKVKKKSLASHLKILANLDVSDIFRIRHPDKTRYTYRQRHGSHVIHRRLDYIFLCNSLQEFADDIDILPSFLSDHSPMFFSLHNSANHNRGRGVWKFNNSLLQDDTFNTDMVHTINRTIAETSSANPHLQWEFLKYEVRKFSIKFSKARSKNSRIDKEKHENNIKYFESNPNNGTVSQEDYNQSKSWLDNWYDDYTKGIILRSKSDWYEQGEKSTKYFLNLEKKNSIQNTIRKIFINKNDQDIECENDEAILDHTKTFYEKLFERKSEKSFSDCTQFLSDITTPLISLENKAMCDTKLCLKDLSDSLNSMTSGKSPGNDGLTIEFYKHF